MKILLINPPYTNYGGMEGYGGKSAPLNLAYLASYVRKKGYNDIFILDAEAAGLTYEKIEFHIMKIKPDLVAMTMPTPTVDHVIKIAEIIKQINKKIWVIVGGYHPTAMPEDIIHNKNIDFAIIGEGEKTFYELVNAIDEKKDFNNIRGIIFKKEGKIIKTEQRELIKNLDEIPFPARDLLDLKLYESSVTKKVSDEIATYLFTSRGCPFNCIYCNAKSMWRRSTRFRSVKNVVDEIEECINKYNIKEFNIGDELFTLNEERTIKICDEILKRNLEISWVCMSRVDTISTELVKKMKQAGCKLISFGFESGSKVILKNIRKMTDLNKAEEAIKIVKKEGIEIFGNFMIGNPGETKKTFNETLKFSKRMNLDRVSFLITVPYPGTDLYNMLKEKKHLDKNLGWSRFSPISNKYPLLRTDELNGDDLLKLQKKAFKSFYLRPKFIINQLKKIKSKEDIKDLISGIKLFLRIEN